MNSGGRTCVVPLHLVAVDALCKPQRESVRLDVRHGRVAGPPGEAFRRPLILVAEQADPVTCLRMHEAINKMARQARRRRMTRLDTHGEVAAQ